MPLVALPFSRGNTIFTSRRDPAGGVSFCLQQGLHAKPRVLLSSTDAPLDNDQPITDFSVSDDGKLCAYFVTQEDKRYEEIRIMDVQTGRRLPDAIHWTHFSDFGWEGNGFYYAAYERPASGSTGYGPEKVYYHRLGTAQEKDRLVYEDPSHPKRKYLFLTTYDHRYFLLHALQRVDGKLMAAEFFKRKGSEVFTAISAQPTSGRLFLIDNSGDHLILHSTIDCPEGHIIDVDTKHPQPSTWREILPKPIDDAEPAAGKIVAIVKARDGGNRAKLFKMNGEPEGDIPTELGTTVDVQAARKQEKYIFLSVEKNGVKNYFAYDVDAKTLRPMD
jgi:prolyl oligopeptidase